MLIYYVNKSYMSTKQQLLEPISTIVKLILLQFKSQNTKISIRNHCMHYDDQSYEKKMSMPMASFQQALTRTLRGDSREDIAVLNNVLINYIEWYIINNNNIESQKIFTNMINMSICGLKKLQNTYLNNYNSVSNVILTLQYYITLIEDIVEKLIKNGKDFKSRVVDINTNELQNIVDIEIIKELWSDEDIVSLHSDLNYCVKHRDNITHNSLIKAKMESITTLLNLKDEIFMNMVKNSIGG